MEKVVETFKNLYIGENIWKKHLYFVLLFVLPAITMSILSYADKDTPKAIVINLVITTLVFLVLSIIPLLMMGGLYLSFIKDRYDGITQGIPYLSKEIMLRALKALPVYLVWGLYSVIFLIAIFGIAALPIILAKVNFFSVFVSIILFFAALIVIFLIFPFFNYVYIKYAKNFEYSKDLFNPMLIVDYIKKSFKDTIIIVLKYYLAGLIVSVAGSIFQFIGVMVVIILSLTFAIGSPEKSDFMYNPVFMVLVILITSVSVVIQTYLTAVVGYACADNFTEVYKSEIEEK